MTPLAERRYRARRMLLLSVWLVAGTAIVARSAVLQLGQASMWRALSDDQHQRSRVVPAPRGSVLDRDGVPLAESRETLRVSVAPRELARTPSGNAEIANDALRSALALTPAEAARYTGSSRNWLVLPGRFPTAVRAHLGRVRGVYLERELERFHPHGDLALGPVGRVVDGQGRGGIEQHYDALLRGSAGEEVSAKDSNGVPRPGQTVLVTPPTSGGEVSLTLDRDLQEIGYEAVEAAIEETEARGGDLLVTDPSTGEVLAMVSIRDGSSTGLSAINTPYEPGSTLKPFTVAGILTHHVARLSDTVDIGEGRWRVAGRTLSDVHPKASRLTLADALRVSSNVGVAKMAQGLSNRDQYETLRDFGFGTQTGVPLPGETPGTLRKPDRWSRQSPASLAIGYEIAVTPIQMAMAYGALANGGLLMAPGLVLEVRAPDGTVQERFEPRVVRRVASEQVTREINRVLVQVVEDGTGTRARLTSFTVAGKSGTSRAYAKGGGYARGDYFASFVGFFPAEDPQLLVYVKLENPKGAYYGGATAAPVTRATMEAILAARRPPLDRRVLANVARRSVEPRQAIRFASSSAEVTASPFAHQDAGIGSVPIPEIAGLSARAAIRRLHAVGLRVVWDASGPIGGTRPEAGVRMTPGDTVRIIVGRAGR